MKLLCLVSLFIFIVSSAYAFTADTPLDNPAAETRAQQLFAKLRCAVCEGQPLAESSAAIAVDMRRTIRHHIAAGRSDAQIIGYLTERYGESILASPGFDVDTVALWTAPFIFLLLALFIAAHYFRGPQA